MTQFGGSFRFVQLPAVAQLLAELRSTGRLCISHAEWSGEIVVRDGQIVGARLGTEQGRAALEAIAVALPDAEFTFTDEPIAEAGDPLITAAERTAYLDCLTAEHQRLGKLIPSLGLVPRLVDVADDNATDTQVTIGAASLQLIPSLVLGHTLEQVARERGLVRTLRDVANLMEGGLVKLEPQPAVPTPAPAMGRPAAERMAAPSAHVLPFAGRSIAARPSAGAAVRSVVAEEATQAGPVRQVPPRLSFVRQSTPGAASAQPPAVSAQPPVVMPAGVAARLSTGRSFALAPMAAERPAKVPLATLRKAIVSFFFTDAESEA